MELLDYLKTKTQAEQAAFAVSVGTTLPHLRNVAYKQRIASAALARQIAERSGGLVPLDVLRPKDWHLIWGRDVKHLVEPGAIVSDSQPSGFDGEGGVQLDDANAPEAGPVDEARHAA